MNGPMQLTLEFLLPKDPKVKSYSVTYPSSVGIPIPELGDLIGDPGGAASYPVKYRTWMYYGPQSLTIILACFDGN